MMFYPGGGYPGLYFPLLNVVRATTFVDAVWQVYEAIDAVFEPVRAIDAVSKDRTEVDGVFP